MGDEGEMAMASRWGNEGIGCSQTHDFLSDLLDIRRGEVPPAGTSPLSDPDLRAAVEQHVFSCKECGQALRELEEIGKAFSQFPAIEPPPLFFEHIGPRIREKAANAERDVPVFPNLALHPSPDQGFDRNRKQAKNSWLGLLLASSAAALLAIALAVNFLFGSNKPQTAKMGGGERPKDESLIAVESPSTSRFFSPRLPIPNRPSSATKVVSLDPQSRREEVVDLSLPGLDELLRAPSRVWAEKRVPPLLGALIQVPLQEKENLPVRGLMVYDVLPGSPAEQAGLSPGALITALNGTSFSEQDLSYFFGAIEGLGEGKCLQIDFETKDRAHWILKRGYATLGNYNK